MRRLGSEEKVLVMNNGFKTVGWMMSLKEGGKGEQGDTFGDEKHRHR